MENSILSDVKKIMGIPESITQFDADLIMHINTVLGILQQLGVGPYDGFMITSADDTWNLFPADIPTNNMVKCYIAYKVKKMFDPPLQQSHITALNETIAELEFRLNISTDV